MMKFKQASKTWLKLGITLCLILPRFGQAEYSYSGVSAPDNVAVDNAAVGGALSSLATANTSSGDPLTDIKTNLAKIKKELKDSAANKAQEEKNFKWAEDLAATNNLINATDVAIQNKAAERVRSDKQAAKTFASMPRLQNSIGSVSSAFSNSNMADSCAAGNGLENIGQAVRGFGPTLSKATDEMALIFRDKEKRDTKAQKAKGAALYQTLLKSLNQPEAPQVAAVDSRSQNFSAAARLAELKKTGGATKQKLNDTNLALIEKFFNPESGLFSKSVDQEQDEKELAETCLQAANIAETNVTQTLALVTQGQQKLFSNCQKVQTGAAQDAQTGIAWITQRDAAKQNPLGAANQAYTNWSNELAELPSCRDESAQSIQVWQTALNQISTWRQACNEGDSSKIADQFGQFSNNFQLALGATAQVVEDEKTACNQNADYRTDLRNKIKPVITAAQAAANGGGISTPPQLQPPTGGSPRSGSGSGNNHGFGGGPRRPSTN